MQMLGRAPGQIELLRRLDVVQAPHRLRDIILEHLESLYEFYGDTAGVRIARKHIGWYCDRLSVPESVRGALLAAGNTGEQFGLAENHLDGWADADRAA